MSSPNHTLVIGGTGMLRDAVIELAKESFAVSVMARTASDLRTLGDDVLAHARHYNPIPVDYRDAAATVEGLSNAIRTLGPITRIVAWIHSVAPEAPLSIARIAAAHAESVEYFHIFGSSAADPKRAGDDRRALFEQIKGLSYHRIILGFVIENGSSRWLRDDEISRGVIEAVATNASEYVVGVVRPWSKHP